MKPSSSDSWPSEAELSIKIRSLRSTLSERLLQSMARISLGKNLRGRQCLVDTLGLMIDLVRLTW